MAKHLRCIGVAGMSLLFLSGCGGQLDKAYDLTTAQLRMNSIAVSSYRADGFAADLAVPGTTSFNADDIEADACLLVPFGEEAPEALAYKNPYVRTYQASITKVMSALVCLEEVTDLQQVFTVTESSVINEAGSSTAWLKVGDQLTIEQLLYGMLVPSGNDAAMAVAEATSGSVEAFVQKMNEKAVALGATKTHFMNPSGLHNDDHYSTPYDIYLIMNAAMQNETFRKIVNTTSYYVEYLNRQDRKMTQVWKGSNQFMTGEVETPDGLQVIGGKTGTTKNAGYCLVMDTVKEETGKEYLSVVMKAETRPELYTDMSTLISKIQ